MHLFLNEKKRRNANDSKNKQMKKGRAWFLVISGRIVYIET